MKSSGLGALLALTACLGSPGAFGPGVAEPLPSTQETQPPEVDALRLRKAEEKRARKNAKRLAARSG